MDGVLEGGKADPFKMFALIVLELKEINVDHQSFVKQFQFLGLKLSFYGRL